MFVFSPVVLVYFCIGSVSLILSLPFNDRVQSNSSFISVVPNLGLWPRLEV